MSRKHINLRPETAVALAELIELRKARLQRKRGAGVNQQDVIADAIALLTEHEWLQHPYKAKLRPQGPSLSEIGGTIMSHNMEFRTDLDLTSGNYIAHCNGEAYMLAEAGKVKPAAVTELVARFDPFAPAQPLTLEEARKSSLYWSLVGVVTNELTTRYAGTTREHGGNNA